MRKKTVTLTIDADVWLAFQSQIDDRERSSTVTNLLRHYLMISLPDKDEVEIKERLEELNKQRENIMEEVSSLSTQLSILQSHKEESKEKIEKWALMVSNSQVKSPWEDVKDV